MKYISEEQKEEKLLANQQVIKTPIVRNVGEMEALLDILSPNYTIDLGEGWLIKKYLTVYWRNLIAVRRLGVFQGAFSIQQRHIDFGIMR